uniref:Uncharacterized protein n=1 Tax=Utricularia reniformis TaxID=192314 RepID=A0A1Y0B3Z9_9LAMI|nr:hypothetical protein AEK19_MT1979 [Utricularia reniformis]ART32142.1 hypothetical protein AEK19_MT1979 [Utricularia reniformis]
MIGEEQVLDLSYLNDLLSDLLLHGSHSWGGGLKGLHTRIDFTAREFHIAS